MDLLLKYNDNIYGVSTINEHRKILEKHNKALWGIIKPKATSPGIGKKSLDILRKKLKGNKKLYAYLATNGKITHKLTITNIYDNRNAVKRLYLIPEYYRKDIDRCIQAIEFDRIERVDEEIINKLQRYNYGGEIVLSNQTNPLYVEERKEKLVSKDVIKEESTQNYKCNIKNTDPKTMIKHIYSYINSRGYIFDFKDIANLYLSLKTKPFVLLAGISGTGKSKLIELFSESIGANIENGRFHFISVKPDWNDNTELFGYNDLNGKYIPGKLTRIIHEANKEENLNKPYIICLDEMNLARVEYYLSDYLSIIETRRSLDGSVKTSRIYPYLASKENEFSDIYISDNIYLIGTVNMDDTTFAFSRKVLDRANTIEFSKVNLDYLEFAKNKISSIEQSNINLQTNFLTIKDAIEYDKEYSKSINNKVIDINNIMEKYNKHFGYRVRDEILFYMIENNINDLINENEALDYQIHQKILPTIVGSEYDVKLLLIDLFNYLNPQNQILDSGNLNYEELLEQSLYKLSSKKIISMIKGYSNGYISYW